MKKTFVLDTNVLIHNPQALFSFEDNKVVIPITVIEEIDNFKKGLDEKGRNARQIGRYLDKIRAKGSLKDGVSLDNGGFLQVAISSEIAELTEKLLSTNINDNLIIGTALYMKKIEPKSIVVLVSKDANVRIKADSVGLTAENFETDKIKFEELYTGLINHEVDEKQFTKMNKESFLPADFADLNPNQFVKLILKGTDDYTLCRYSAENKSIYPLAFYKNQEIFGIKALNDEQRMAFDLLLDDSIKLVTLVGKAGTGKTLLAIAAGLTKVLEENKYKRLVISRPISPLGKDIGYLPGTKSEKMNPWMQPIYDNMEFLISGKNEQEEKTNGKIFGKRKPSIEDYLDFNFVELEPLTYIRGRSLPNQFLIIDEAQNLTPHEMKTIITRAGSGTKIVLTGDPYQIDIPYLDSESNGLSMAVEKFKSELIIGHITLEKGERSTLADIAAKYF
ncbi:MAG: PhoH family protein [Candidatus Cloacimonetes bacterium]|nr:PhoH family protein [Candidatus Cloacimonadota bacterium]